MKSIDQRENTSERLAAFGWVPSLHEDVTSDRRIAQLSDYRAVGVRFRYIPDARSILVEDEDGNSTGIRIQAMDEYGHCRILLRDQPGSSGTEGNGSDE